jgi:hypothetical protein
MAISAEEGDYVVVKDGKKKFLVQVTSASDGEYTGVVDGRARAHPDTQENIEFSDAEMVASLGSNPEFGVVHGVKVQPFQDYFLLKGWGHVYSFRPMEDRERDTVVGMLKDAFKRYKSLGIHYRLPIDIEIHPAKGKYAGRYRYTGKDEELDTMFLHPKDILSADTQDIIDHEFGHHVWFRLLPSELRAKWISLYGRYVTVQEVTSKKIVQLGKDFASSGQSIAGFRNEIPDDDQQAFDMCLGYLNDVHSITGEDLDTIISVGRFPRNKWPEKAMDFGDKEVPITEYANRNVWEFWAEAFAHYMGDKDLPDDVRRAVRVTLKEVGGG